MKFDLAKNSGLLIRVVEDNELIFSLLMLFIHGASSMLIKGIREKWQFLLALFWL